jgi:predicted TIM-barrel fold metal-dependent hydrolase
MKAGEIMIIDSHTHLTFRQSESLDSELQRLIGAMERTHVDKACIMLRMEEQERHFFWTEDDIVNSADAMAEAVVKYPDKFYTLLWMHPVLSKEFNIKIVEKYMVNGPLDGVKLSIQMNARDKRLEPLADYLQAYNIPVLFHSWYKTVNKYQYESDPADIADLAARFPKLRILIAHVTGCKKRGVQDIKKHENVLIDTSGSQPEDGYLEYAINHLGEDRVVFGSDYPGREIATQLGRIYSLDMSASTREKIFYKNAISFFTKGGECK